VERGILSSAGIMLHMLGLSRDSPPHRWQ
jgi:hypothetical protein